jgi:ubiquinone/menaquinone biosynthesis C-methylase UbiE
MTGAIYSTGAIGYDEFFGQVTRLFILALMETAQLREGQAVLDVATGTGVAAEGAVAGRPIWVGDRWGCFAQHAGRRS